MRPEVRRWLSDGFMLWVVLGSIVLVSGAGVLGFELPLPRRTAPWHLREAPLASLVLASFCVLALAALWLAPEPRRGARRALGVTLSVAGVVAALTVAPMLVLLVVTGRTLLRSRPEAEVGPQPPPLPRLALLLVPVAAALLTAGLAAGLASREGRSAPVGIAVVSLLALLLTSLTLVERPFGSHRAPQ